MTTVEDIKRKFYSLRLLVPTHFINKITVIFPFVFLYAIWKLIVCIAFTKAYWYW